jgi:hypothetical protein
MPVPYAKLNDPQSLNLYAYVMNNPMTRFDPDGHFDCSGANASGIGCQTQAAWKAMNNGTATSVEDFMSQKNAAQQQSSNSSSNGPGFWHSVGQGFNNLAHLRGWNNDGSKVGIEQGPGTATEPNPYVTATADGLGIVAAVTHNGKLGAAASIISVANDPSPQNLATTALGSIPGPDIPMAFLVPEADLLNAEVQIAGQGMINAIPAEEGDPVDSNGIRVSMPGDNGIW